MANHAEVLSALGRFEAATELAVEVLRTSNLSNPDRPRFESTMACLAAVTKNMSEHSRPDEVAASLFHIVNLVEKVPEKCRHFASSVCGPFHRHLAVCLEKQGNLAGAELVLMKGLRHMAAAFLMPRLRPPTLVNTLLETPRDDEETRGRLVRELTQHLDSEDGRFSVDFLQQMANIGRHLYIWDRPDDCWELLDALCSHLEAEWGETHVQTKAMLDFRDDMIVWFYEARENGEKLNAERTAAQGVDSGVDVAAGDSSEGNAPETAAG
jgi:hypothetical protein